MSFVGFAIFVVLILCAAWCYQWLKRVEIEIRAELESAAQAAQAAAATEQKEPRPAENGSGEKEGSPGGAPGPGDSTPADIILEVIRQHPGIRQADIYGLVPDMSKRRIQALVRSLEEEGRLRRVRDRGSYRLEMV
ncbi:MAG: hypothetical protein D6794_01815 [Deltaproteobacteria bacterium]|nr:MAG: hypothetical protein D6794_01815 [Deltaproteobacteria bacterium]